MKVQKHKNEGTRRCSYGFFRSCVSFQPLLEGPTPGCFQGFGPMRGFPAVYGWGWPHLGNFAATPLVEIDLACLSDVWLRVNLQCVSFPGIFLGRSQFELVHEVPWISRDQFRLQIWWPLQRYFWTSWLCVPWLPYWPIYVSPATYRTCECISFTSTCKLFLIFRNRANYRS